jgi:hypothetical protein
VAWDNPYEVAFGTTGLLGITLSNETFSLPGAATVQAQFSLIRADTPSPVPEPASMILFGSAGLVAVIRARRRQKA